MQTGYDQNKWREVIAAADALGCPVIVPATEGYWECFSTSQHGVSGIARDPKAAYEIMQREIKRKEA